VSGFLFDAKAVRAAIAAGRAERGNAAVLAVVAVYETAAAREPQEPQQPQTGSLPSSCAGTKATTATTASFCDRTIDEIDAIEERAALAADCMPPIYLDAWARLQCQRPLSVSPDRWGTAINDAGLFLDAWGEQAAEFGWSAGELFDIPRDDVRGGLVWFIEGSRIAALSERHARTADGARTFGRRNESEGQTVEPS
jgi:hypothetical protein